MPEKKTVERARKDAREGKAPSTQAGEFIKEQFDHIREGKHGARSPEQAIAIGLSEARRAGVDLPAPDESKYGEEVKHKAERELASCTRRMGIFPHRFSRPLEHRRRRKPCRRVI